MASPTHIGELLKGIDLAWWPEFLLMMRNEPSGGQEASQAASQQPSAPTTQSP
ncbi:MAG TPA: hypothetical protein VER03_02455 [Bryobacteraceae bacterium]|nr:hypothetical protein [Bryobacteraceae bacterium]